MGVLIVLAAVIGVPVIVAIVLYNSLVAKKQRVNQAFADVDVQLRQRHDLIPNLIEAVKGYASHERETLDAVIEARNAAMNTSHDLDHVESAARAESALSSALGRLFALAEAYPDLKANTNFLQLQSELADTEDKIAAARRFFNSAVSEYNTMQEQFPSNIIASMGPFAPAMFFDLGSTREAMLEPPKVDFSGN